MAEVEEIGEAVVKALDALFAPWNRSDAPGLVVGVAQAGEVLYRRGFGMASLEQASANTPRTRMRIGSTTKHFTCLAALLLAKEGKLDIDAGVRTVIPELPALEGEPSLRQLMSHTGGYRCYLDLSMLSNGFAILPEGASLDYMTRQRAANFAPGEQMIYCNGGYVLISVAIERAGGVPLRTFFRDRIFAPTGMIDTDLVPSDLEIATGAATLHVAGPDGFRRGIFPSEEVIGEGGMISSVDDMLTWLAHLRTPTTIGDADIWRQMLTRASYAGGSGGDYCLGLMRPTYRGVETLHHAGGVFGGASQMLTVPAHELDVIIMTNRSDVVPTDLAERIIDIVLADRLGPAPRFLDEDDGKGLIGRYFSPRTGVLYSIGKSEAGFGLRINNTQGRPLRIERAADGSLRAVAGSLSEITIAGVDLAASPAQTLEITVAGRMDVHRRLPDEAPPAQSLVALVGDFENHDSDSRAGIALEGETMALVVAGRFGRARYEIKPLSEDVLLFRNPLSAGCLTVVRRDGAVTGFLMNTARTRRLLFTRSAE
jgi:CubicO group peptidase (beta-lactamase class C family)